MKRDHNGGGKKTSNGGTTLLRTGRDWASGRGRRGGGWLKKWWRKDKTKKGEPTGVGRGTSNAEVIKRGATRRGTRRKKRALGVGMQGPTGPWGAG